MSLHAVEVVVILLFVVGGLLLYFQVIRPLAHLREALKRLAVGDYRPVLIKTRLGAFRKTALHVRSISELLQQLDRQITVDGFSLRAILSSMVEGVLIVDHSQRIRLANDSLERMFRLGRSPVNRSVIEVFRSHELQIALQNTLSDGLPQSIEISLDTQTKDGYAVRHFEVYASALNPQPRGPVRGAVVVFHDITTVKELETVRQEFVANVSHEFRTPLAIINGYVETLQDGATDDPEMVAHSLKVMHKNSQRLTVLIEDLLTISRLEHRSFRMDFQRTNLRETLHRVMERMEPAIRDHQAKIEIDWPVEAEIVEADQPRIEQIYSNLLENALRYGHAQDNRIIITARKSASSVDVVFADNGPGIPLEDQPHIFERFYRVHKDRSRVAGGSGLGLSIVKHITQAHGGHISVVSTPGKGAAFTVELPLTQNNESASSRALRP